MCVQSSRSSTSALPWRARQHRVTAALAGFDLPVPAPVTAGDDSMIVIDGAVYAVVPWAAGVHCAGTTLTLAEAAALGDLLARLHSALATVMPPAQDRFVVATAHAKIDRYLGLIAQQPACDDFDRYAETQLHHRRRLLEQATDLRPTEGMPVTPCGYTHGDFQHLHWASRLLEMLVSVQMRCAWPAGARRLGRGL